MKRLAVLVVTACSDFDPPSALTHTQIIAVRATPAAIVEGERAQLDALVAGPTGVLEPTLSWRILAGPDGVTIEDGGWLVAGAGASGDVLVALDADGLTAEKVVRVGEHRDNPQFAQATVDGVALEDELHVMRGASVELAAALDGAESVISWFATVGEISLYRAPQTELHAPREAATGTLVIVGRDGRGGVTWRIARIIVD